MLERKWLIDLFFDEAIKQVIRLNIENKNPRIYYITANARFPKLDNVGVYQIKEVGSDSL